MSFPIPVHTPPPPRSLRLVQVYGDAYEPSLRHGDFLMVATERRFAYDSDYLLDFGDGEAPYLVTRTVEGFAIRHRNPKYVGFDLTERQFNQAVRAIVVAELKVRDKGRVYTAFSDHDLPIVRTAEPQVPA